jgi:hypothetical protein
MRCPCLHDDPGKGSDEFWGWDQFDLAQTFADVLQLGIHINGRGCRFRWTPSVPSGCGRVGCRSCSRSTTISSSPRNGGVVEENSSSSQARMVGEPAPIPLRACSVSHKISTRHHCLLLSDGECRGPCQDVVITVRNSVSRRASVSHESFRLDVNLFKNLLQRNRGTFLSDNLAERKGERVKSKASLRKEIAHRM